jgi:predicted HAD superfamily phosphohydrolase
MLNKDYVVSIELYYYVYSTTNKQTIPNSKKTLPSFQVRMPDDEQKEVLKILSSKKEGMTKNNLLIEIDENYKTSTRKEKSKLIMEFNRKIIDKLSYDWGMIEKTGKSKGAVITLNQRGEEFSRFI